MPQNPHVLLTFDKIHNLMRLPRETTSEPPKVVRTPSAFNMLTSKCASRHNGMHFFEILNFQKWSGVRTPSVFNILTSKCASRHNGVHFFDISTSKSAPTMVCFVHVGFEMCFAPQRRALFQHLNCQSGPELVFFVHFDLETCFAPQRHALFRHRNS